MFHQLFSFKGVHHIVELFKADENLVNVVACDFIRFDRLLLCTGIHQIVFGFLDFIVHPVEPLVKVRFADDVVAVIRVKCVDLLYDFGFDGVMLPQHFFGGSNFLFNGSGVYFAADFLLHHGGKLWIADQLDDNLHHGIVQNFLLNLLVEIAFLPTLHLAVLATVIRERFIGCPVFLAFSAFVTIHSGTANGCRITIDVLQSRIKRKTNESSCGTVKLLAQTYTERGNTFVMNTVTQTMRFRQSLLNYAEKHGVTKAAIKYNVNRQYICRWKRRYNGDIQSLANKSHRPHHHPNQHTEEELRQITNFRRRNPNTGLVVLWVKLRRSGYTRSITGLYRVLHRQGQMTVKLPNPKYIPKPYEQMHFPGERVQVDVKFVPEVCIVGDAKGEKFYQYTVIDEFSRWRYLEAFQEHSSYSSAVFLEHLIKAAPFEIQCIQTDNGAEFTKKFVSDKARPHLFEMKLEDLGIRHKLIKPFTPRHNGKVERSHRKDNENFYASHRFYSFPDFQKQLAVYSRKYNRFPIRPLGWLDPLAFLAKYRNQASAPTV